MLVTQIYTDRVSQTDAMLSQTGVIIRRSSSASASALFVVSSPSPRQRPRSALSSVSHVENRTGELVFGHLLTF